jgi:hypothetical protein
MQLVTQVAIAPGTDLFAIAPGTDASAYALITDQRMVRYLIKDHKYTAELLFKGKRQQKS